MIKKFSAGDPNFVHPSIRAQEDIKKMSLPEMDRQLKLPIHTGYK